MDGQSDNQSSVVAEDEPSAEYDLQTRLIRFALRIIDVVDHLPNSLTGRHIAGQLLRSGTAVAPNHGEAKAAESRKDFIHKMKIALKELRESEVWLKIIRGKPLIEPETKLDPLIKECDELIAIFIVSVATARKNLGKEKMNKGTFNKEQGTGEQ